ncbi:hypothetical protein [Psychrobacter sp. UBA3962]|uniref:hypothetical protein n=1 Tax=Psychrobacter sp. UBA3962 TaxID=1947352 RepID=UPI0025D0F7B2|nr:hypothetical protein [Psychrobacter sp. UBA3962]
MKNIILLISISVLTACSFSGFQPPRNTSYWTLPGLENMGFEGTEYIDKKFKEMRECGIDPFVGDTNNVKKRLCMEEKGWRNTEGLTCEVDFFKDNPACDDWKRQHGK